jgi:tRNA 2-thiouridine synthesizing protein A
MSELKVVKTLDTSGMSCPMPVVKTKKAIKEMEIGAILEMISTDPGSIPDMEAWARQTKHDLLESHDEGDKYRFLIRKTH